jgi:hypothetical protein
VRASEPAGEILSEAKDLGLSDAKLNMVEAAGVEPASEIHVSRETPCVVEFRRFRATRSEPTRCA